MLSATRGTSPASLAELQILVLSTTLTAQLAAREELVDNDHLSASPAGLVLELTTKLAHAGVRDAMTQTWQATRHAFHRQIFNRDQLVARDERGRRLMQQVLPGVAHLSVQPGNSDPVADETA